MLVAFIVFVFSSGTSFAGLTVSKQASTPASGTFLISQTLQDGGGNTRFRFYPRDLRDPAIYGFDAVARPDEDAANNGVNNAHRFRLRDRDLGQIFTIPESTPGPVYFDAVTLRVGPTASANEGGAGGAAVSMQLYEVTGTPSIDTNGTTGSMRSCWSTFDPTRATTDDFVAGQTYTLLAVASGGVLPTDITTNNYMRWELSGNSRILMEPGKQYAFLVMFDEPGIDRGLALANRNTASWTPPINFGPMPGGYGVRREGGSTDFYDVMFDPADLDDQEIAFESAVFPFDLAACRSEKTGA